jgi:hypothetical protein
VPAIGARLERGAAGAAVRGGPLGMPAGRVAEIGRLHAAGGVDEVGNLVEPAGSEINRKHAGARGIGK